MHPDWGGREKGVQPEQPAAFSGFQPSMPLGTSETRGAFIVSRDLLSSLST